MTVVKVVSYIRLSSSWIGLETTPN